MADQMIPVNPTWWPIGPNQGNPFTLRPSRVKFFTYLHAFQAGQPTGVLVGTGTGTQSSDAITIDGDSDFAELKLAMFESAATSGDFAQLDDTIEFKTTPQQDALNTPPMYLSSLGTGQYPTILAPPYYLPRNAIYTATAYSRSTLHENSTILIAHHGVKVYPQVIRPARAYRRSRAFAYILSLTSFDSQTVAASSTVTAQVRTDGDSDFLVQKISVLSDTDITVQINSDSDNWSNKPLRNSLLGGSAIAAVGAGAFTSGQLPFVLPGPRLITSAAYVLATVANLDAAAATRVQIILWGQRCYF